MDVDVGIFMRLPDLIVIDLGQPVIGCDRAGVAQDKPAHRIGDRRVLFYTPVRDLHITVNDLFIIQQGGVQVPYLLPLLSVKDISFRHVVIACLDQDGLHTVLDILHRDQAVFYLRLESRRHLQCQHIYDILVIVLFLCLKCFPDRLADLGQIKFCDLSVSLCNLIHLPQPLSFS